MSRQTKERKIIHVDMDAFYAAVEMRDDPTLKGKPVIIGSLPGERGVVATCNYKARSFGVRSAMPISKAYQLCPQGHYMYPNMKKYQEVSQQIHQIWTTYTDVIEYISLDEGFLDVTGSEKLFGDAKIIAQEIKRRTWEEIGLTCSVGLGYCMSAAKLASEEKKPNGYFELLSPAAMVALIKPRSVRVVYTVGPKTEARLRRLGIHTVADLFQHEKRVLDVLGNHGASILDLARGIDLRPVGSRTRGQSIGTEQTFQTDITDRAYLKDVLRLIARKLSLELKRKGLYAKTVTLKVTYPGMQTITRSKTSDATQWALEIYNRIEILFEATEAIPIRLIGITVSNLTKHKTVAKAKNTQMSLFDPDPEAKKPKTGEQLNDVLYRLQQVHGVNVLKTASELAAESRVKAQGSEKEKRKVVSSYVREREDDATQ